jgi:hypothetical protein
MIYLLIWHVLCKNKIEKRVIEEKFCFMPEILHYNICVNQRKEGIKHA